MLTTQKTINRGDSLVRVAYDSLKALAISKGPSSKLPTNRELCEILHLSRTTIDSALDELEDARIIFRRQGSGIYVSPTINRKTIAIIFNSTLLAANASPFWGTLLSQFAMLAETRRLESDQDFEFFITPPSGQRHGEIPEHVKKSVLAGAIHGAVGINLRAECVEWLLNQGVRCSAYAGWSKWTVETNNENLIRAGFQALVGQGCRNIEFWGPPLDIENGNSGWYERRNRDIDAAYAAFGIDPPQTSVDHVADLLADYTLPGGERAYNAIKALLGDPARPRPDGILFGEDTMAAGAILGLLELGVRPGVDIKIASHANRTSPILLGTQKQLTLLEYDPAEIADALVHLLDQAMENPDLPDTEIHVPFQVRLPDGLK